MFENNCSQSMGPLIFGQLLAYAGSGINKVTADFGAGSILSNRLMIL